LTLRSLHIRQISEADAACYMCQLNTANMKKQVGCIEVLGELVFKEIWKKHELILMGIQDVADSELAKSKLD